MSILDYTKDLRLFDAYDRKFLQMMIDYYKLKENPLFDYLNDINIDNVEMFWYKDSNPQVLGGFHMISQNVIYLSLQDDTIIQRMKYTKKGNNVILLFPTIMHELCHYWQYQKNKLLYLFLQIPLIRDFTIQKQAYKISDYLDEENNILLYKSMKEIAELKKEYGFAEFQFDEIQNKSLETL